MQSPFIVQPATFLFEAGSDANLPPSALNSSMAYSLRQFKGLTMHQALLRFGGHTHPGEQFDIFSVFVRNIRLTRKQHSSRYGLMACSRQPQLLSLSTGQTQFSKDTLTVRERPAVVLLL